MVLSNMIQINAEEITNYSYDLSKGGFSKRLFHNMLPCGYWTLIYKLYCSQTHSRQHDILLVLPQTSTILAQKISWGSKCNITPTLQTCGKTSRRSDTQICRVHFKMVSQPFVIKLLRAVKRAGDRVHEMDERKGFLRKRSFHCGSLTHETDNF